jgi:hypothetical protein
MIAKRVTCLLYMTSIYLLYGNSMNPSTYTKHVEFDYFPWSAKFEMIGICGRNWRRYVDAI